MTTCNGQLLTDSSVNFSSKLFFDLIFVVFLYSLFIIYRSKEIWWAQNVLWTLKCFTFSQWYLLPCLDLPYQWSDKSKLITKKKFSIRQQNNINLIREMNRIKMLNANNSISIISNSSCRSIWTTKGNPFSPFVSNTSHTLKGKQLPYSLSFVDCLFLKPNEDDEMTTEDNFQ